MVAGLFGAGGVTASRLVRGSAADLLTRLDEWMQREESLRTKRRFSDRLTWEARRDLLGSIQQGLNIGGRSFALTTADEVGATVVAVDGERCMVRLDAEYARSRRRHVTGGAVVAGGGLLGFAGVLALATVIPLTTGQIVAVAAAITLAFAVWVVARRPRARAQG